MGAIIIPILWIINAGSALHTHIHTHGWWAGELGRECCMPIHRSQPPYEILNNIKSASRPQHARSTTHFCKAVPQRFFYTEKWMRMLPLFSQSCPTLCNPMTCSPTGSCVHGDFPGKNTGVSCHFLFQGSSWPRNWTTVSCTAGRFFTNEPSAQMPIPRSCSLPSISPYKTFPRNQRTLVFDKL